MHWQNERGESEDEEVASGDCGRPADICCPFQRRWRLHLDHVSAARAEVPGEVTERVCPAGVVPICLFADFGCGVTVVGWLLTTALLAIPENFLQLYVALRLQGVSVPFRRLAAYSTLAAVVLKASRLLPWPFGLHVPLHAVLMIMLIRYLAQGSWMMSLIGALAAQLLIAIGEGLVAVPLMHALRYTYKDVLTNPFLNVAFGYVADSILMIVAGYCWVRQRNLKAREG